MKLLLFLTLQEKFKGFNLTKERTLSKKGTKRHVINAASAKRLHPRKYTSDWKPGRNNMNAPSVSKHLKALPLLQFINEYTQEKSPINVLSVERLLVKWVVSRYT